MDPEQRKIYNKKYYDTNKAKIIEKATTKVECEFCKRSVIHNNILKHYKSEICKRKSKELQEHYKRLIDLQIK